MLIEHDTQVSAPPSAVADPGVAVAGSPALARNALSAVEAFGQSLAATGPSIAIAGTIPVVYLEAGNGTVYSVILGTVIVLLVGYSVAQFARRVVGAGSLYSYIGLGLGRAPAFSAGWAIIIGYLGIAAACLVGAALYSGAFLDSIGLKSGAGVPVQLGLLAAATVLAVVFPVRGVRLSARVGIGLEVTSLLAIAGALVATVAHFGFRLDSVQLTAKGSSLSAIMLGTVLAVTTFVGFESAGSLGAETRDPHRAIPRAVLGTVLGAGVLYLVSTYVQVIGFNASNGLASSAAPLNDIATAAGVGWLTYVLDLGITMSAVACASACITAAARGLYSLSREGILPTAFGRVHPVLKTPHVAVYLLGVIAGLVPFALIALGNGELPVYAWTATFGTFGYLLAYLLVVIALPVYLRRRGESITGPLVAGTLAAVAILYVTYKNLVPVPAWPVNILPYGFAVVTVAALAWYGLLYRRNPVRARGLGTLVEHADRDA